MCSEDAFHHALDYFTSPDHPQSFELRGGTGGVLLSAPHAVLQTRNGRIKCAERFTGMLCLMLNERTGCPCVMKTRHLCDDANHDPQSDYRDALCTYVRSHGIHTVLDLHQLAPERPMALCIGTGRGRNLHGNERLVPLVRECFMVRGLGEITVDEPFAAMNPHTVAADAAERCSVPALQLELNTSLLLNNPTACRFGAVLDALADVISQLNGRSFCSFKGSVSP